LFIIHLLLEFGGYRNRELPVGRQVLPAASGATQPIPIKGRTASLRQSLVYSHRLLSNPTYFIEQSRPKVDRNSNDEPGATQMPRQSF
jgi:hypothetical protein